MCDSPCHLAGIKVGKKVELVIQFFLFLRLPGSRVAGCLEDTCLYLDPTQIIKGQVPFSHPVEENPQVLPLGANSAESSFRHVKDRENKRQKRSKLDLILGSREA